MKPVPARCPWCFSTATVRRHGAYAVICDNALCDASGPIRDVAADAVRAWNDIADLVALARAEAPKRVAAPETFAAIVRTAVRTNAP